MTTKGDLLTRDGSTVVRLGVGSNDYVLTADSSTSSGLAWKPTAEAGTSVQEGRNIKTYLIMEINP